MEPLPEGSEVFFNWAHEAATAQPGFYQPLPSAPRASCPVHLLARVPTILWYPPDPAKMQPFFRAVLGPPQLQNFLFLPVLPSYGQRPPCGL